MPMDLNNILITILTIIGVVVGISLFIGFAVYFFITRARNKAEEKNKFNLTFLQIKLPQQNEIEIKAAEQMFSGLMGFRKSFWQSLKSDQYRISFEIVSKEEGIGFYVVVPDDLVLAVEKQINAAYPQAEIDIINPNEVWDRGKYTAVMDLKLAGASYYPIKTYEDMGTDTLNYITSSMSKLDKDEVITIQYIIRPASNKWRNAGSQFINSVKAKNSSEKPTNIDPAFLQGIEKKIAKPGFDTVIRVIAIAKDKVVAETHLNSIQSAFEQFTDVTYNRFKSGGIRSSTRFVDEFIYRELHSIEWHIPILEKTIRRNTSLLTTAELATVFHFPNKDVQTPNIMWMGASKSPAPTEVPQQGFLLGKNYFRGVEKPVFINPEDRRRHMYIIGQTGTGKSEFLKAMALQDIKNGQGVAIIDPHGSDIDYILNRIPKERIDDVILFDVSDTERPLGINILSAETEEQKNMLINSFIALLYKLYDPNRSGIMGPQLERTIRNIMLTVMVDPEATLVDVLRMVIDPEYSKKFMPLITDPLVKRYWTDEIANTTDFHKSDKMGYFVSKFDRFVTERTMRNILGQPKSSFNFDSVMQDKKIFLADLSKGKIGEENSIFLGLLLVPRILMSALGRAKYYGKQDFPDFYLYVDEFQNFATPDFATILSEARKYKLNLIVANQFIAQLSADIKDAVFGNVGTLVAFRVGQDDAEYLEHQMNPVFKHADLINVPIGNAYMRLLVDGKPTVPFSMAVEWDKETNDISKKYTDVPFDESVAAEIRKRSREKYGVAVNEVEEYINVRLGFNAKGTQPAEVIPPLPKMPF